MAVWPRELAVQLIDWSVPLSNRRQIAKANEAENVLAFIMNGSPSALLHHDATFPLMSVLLTSVILWDKIH